MKVLSEENQLALRAPADSLPGMSTTRIFRYFKTSPEIIRLLVMMYVRYPLSLRNVEDLLHDRGIDITHDTVRFWRNRFRTIFAAEIRRNRVPTMRSFRQRQVECLERGRKRNGGSVPGSCQKQTLGTCACQFLEELCDRGAYASLRSVISISKLSRSAVAYRLNPEMALASREAIASDLSNHFASDPSATRDARADDIGKQLLNRHGCAARWRQC